MAAPVRGVTVAVAQPCPWCGSDAAVGTCPLAITCPHCDAPPGLGCKRPSGHRASVLHAARIEQAETRDFRAQFARGNANQAPEQPGLFMAEQPGQTALDV